MRSAYEYDDDKSWQHDAGDGKALRPLRIELGITDNRTTEVVAGELKAGDQVIVGENTASSGGKPSSVGMRLF